MIDVPTSEGIRSSALVIVPRWATMSLSGLGQSNVGHLLLVADA